MMLGHTETNAGVFRIMDEFRKLTFSLWVTRMRKRIPVASSIKLPVSLLLGAALTCTTVRALDVPQDGAVKPQSVAAVDKKPVRRVSPELIARLESVALEGQKREGTNAVDLIVPFGLALRQQINDLGEQRLAGVRGDTVDLQALTSPEATEADRNNARVLLAGLLTDENRAALAAIAAAPYVLHPVDATQPLFMQVTNWVGHCRAITRLQSGRMAIALERNDITQWRTALYELLTLSEQVANDPKLISALVAIAVRSVAFEHIQCYVISPHRDEALLGELAIKLASPTLFATYTRALRGEALMFEDSADLVYAYGAAGPAMLSGKGPFPPPEPGAAIAPDVAVGPGYPSRNEQMALAATYYAGVLSLDPLSGCERGAAPVLKELKDAHTKSLLLELMGGGIFTSFTALNQARTDHQATLTMIALERYKISKGAYPESLEPLVPMYLPSLPRDWFSGSTVGYIPPGTAHFAGGRSYILYSSGTDCVDDGGKVNFDKPFASNARDGSGKGTDFLLNRTAPVASTPTAPPP
jgi:hypothetical protein